MDLSRYSDTQAQAITTTEGPVLVLAGAGSGKTGVLTGRVAYLIKEKNVSPFSILAITFTNKAADEMKKRISSLISTDVRNMDVSTFHSFCAKLLRFHAKTIGYTSSFTIYDTDDSIRIIKDLLNENSYNIEMTPSAILSVISRAKNTSMRLSYSDFFDHMGAGDDFLRLFNDYNSRLKKENAMDFDDLLLNVILLFDEDRNIREFYQNKYRYVLVDEFQDTNSIQYEIVKIISEKYKNIFVVGDDDQSIYSWRGADINNILSFEKTYKNAAVIKLEQNYRSHQRILDVSNAVISKSLMRKDKMLWSSRKTGDKPKLRTFENEYQEAEFVAREISLKAQTGTSYSQFAVLYRSHTQSRVIEEKLRQLGIPYTVIGGVGFYSRKEIKDIIAYMTLIVNPDSNTAFKRVVNTPRRGIGDSSLAKVLGIAESRGVSGYDMLRYYDQELEHPLRKRFSSFTDTMAAIELASQDKGVASLIEDILEITGYERMLMEEKDSEARLENIEELINAATDYEASSEDPSLTDFLTGISLFTDADDEDSDDKVTLMTLHAAKGLEFDTVFMVGMEETVFPSYKSVMEGNVEEERRLCYVGMTRAKKELYLTNCKVRSMYARTESKEVSRFIKDIPKDLLDMPEERTLQRRRPEYSYIPTVSIKQNSAQSFPKAKRDTSVFEEGMTVNHKTFGKGIIISISGTGESKIALVRFASGEKKMYLSFAPIEIAD